MDALYEPKRFLTLDLLAGVVAAFTWPAPYQLEDELPDGIVMRFPHCSLLFVEGYEGDMEIQFLEEETHSQHVLKLGHALSVVVPASQRGEVPLTPGLIDDTSAHASLDKVKHGIHDLCTIVLTHLQPCILGDFSWVHLYEAHVKAQQEG